MPNKIFKIYSIVAIVCLVILGLMPRTSQAVIPDNSFNRILNPQAGITSTGTLYVRGYVYPIGELGNCSSKSDCFEYCELMENIPTCANFSERHGIMKPGMAQAVQTLVSALLSGNRPGACNSLNDCVSYCDHPEAYTDCAGYVQKLALNSSVLGASTSALTAQLPSGLLSYCNTQQSCATYCASSHNSDCASLPPSTDLSSVSYITPQIQQLITDSQNFTENNSQSTASLPQVKSRTIVNEDAIGQQLQDCLGNAIGSIVPGTPTATNPLPASNTALYQQQSNQCAQQANAQVPTIADTEAASQAQSIGDITSIESCFSQIKNFAQDYKQCLSQ